ncbi:putative 11-beta-hydroxysteroid dehydrogenase [Helianthus annuus]|nr:putative 11-beta-hydroxysteroid dehydrogenase [Helianthus annuus]
MDLTHKFLNIVLPIASIFLFIFILPLLSVYRLLRFCIRSLFPENLAGKVVLITGASAGIGEKVLGVVAEKAKELGSPDAIVIKADVSKLEDCKRFVDETINHFGKCEFHNFITSKH